MGIIIIPNQSIRFNNVAEPETCVCMGQSFAQLVNNADETKFQIKSTNIAINGSFTSDLSSWVVYLGITGTAVLFNETVSGECDGAVEITASGGTPAYMYSIDGISFQESNIFDDLCSGHYSVIIKDSIGREGAVEFDITTNIVCGSYAGSDTDDLLPLNTNQILNCLTSDFI